MGLSNYLQSRVDSSFPVVYLLHGVGLKNVNAGKEVAMESAVPSGQHSDPGTASGTPDTQPVIDSGVSRNIIVTLRTLVAISAFATIGFAISLWPFTVLPAITTIILYVILVGTDFVLHRNLPWADSETDSENEAGDTPIHSEDIAALAEAEKQHWMEQERHREKDEAQLSAEEKGMLMVTVPAVLCLLLCAAVLAAIFIGWKFVALGGLLIFCYLLLIGGPIWIAAIEEKRETEHERVTGEKAEAIQ